MTDPETERLREELSEAREALLAADLATRRRGDVWEHEEWKVIGPALTRAARSEDDPSWRERYERK